MTDYEIKDNMRLVGEREAIKRSRRQCTTGHQDLDKDKAIEWYLKIGFEDGHASAVEALAPLLSEACEALEKIEDPRKRDHQEPDKYTEVGCMMNMAGEALASIKAKLESMK